MSEDNVTELFVNECGGILTPDKNTGIPYEVAGSGEFQAYPQANICTFRREHFEKHMHACVNTRSSKKGEAITKANTIHNKDMLCVFDGGKMETTLCFLAPSHIMTAKEPFTVQKCRNPCQKKCKSSTNKIPLKRE